MRPALLCIALCVALSANCIADAMTSKRSIYEWMCLERCGGNATSIAANLRQATRLSGSLLQGVSYEMFNLGANGTLVQNNLTAVTTALRAAGLVTIPMISSYPYPPQFLSWMREVWANPEPFLETAVNTAIQYNFDGYNVDWEPDTVKNITADDAANYAKFLDLFATRMHQHQKILTVDVATWSPLWNYTLLSATALDQIMVMSTYTDDFTAFEAQLKKAVAEIDLSKLVIGLETVRASDNKPYTTAQLQQRFAVLAQVPQVTRLALWDAPIPDNWLPFLIQFMQQS